MFLYRDIEPATGDESLFLLSICTTTNKPTNQRTDQETKFQFWRVCACSRRYTLRSAMHDVRPPCNRVHRLYTHPDESTRLLGKRETRNYFKIRSVFRGNFSRNRHRSPRRWISRQEISPTGRIARNRIETSIRSFNVDGRIV